MNRFLLAAIIIAVCIPIALSEVTDMQLREILGRAGSYIDDPDGGPGEVRHAIKVSGDDTNRVVSLMKQLIAEGTCREGIAGFYISQIGKYGTCADLPFLYPRVATPNLCEDAVFSIVKIEGVTTGSVSRICAALRGINPASRSGVSAWITLAAEVRDGCADPAVRNMMISNAVQYAARQTFYVDGIDQSIMRFDPSYQMSRRRLAAMRTITNLGVHPSRTNYVNNAIRDLVAYPESNLPE